MQHLADALAQLGTRQAVEFAEELQVFAGGQIGVDGEFLRHDADEPAHGTVRRHQGFALQPHLAAGGV